MAKQQGVCITQRLEFDYGHRLPMHGGKCKDYHGHRGVVKLTVRGPVQKDGMVVDFGAIKDIMKSRIDTNFDHGMLLQKGDPLIEWLFNNRHKVMVMDEAPSAENIAKVLYNMAKKLFEPNVTVERVVFYETPNCSASHP